MLKVRILLYGAGRPFNNAIIKCPVPVMLEAKVLPFILVFWCIWHLQYKFILIFLVPNPFLVLADAYYIPLVC